MGRDPKHDYRSRCIYHITVGKAPCCPEFSRITGSLSNPKIDKTPIGLIVEKQILNFPNLCPSLQILQYVIMPDHIHFAIFAKDYLPKAIGSYIGMMKVKTGQLVRTSFPEIKDIFSEDFHDRYLRPIHNLGTIINYIRQNPYRLLARCLNPDYFRRINNIQINDSYWQAYGNIHLLDNPFKAPVIIHRSDSEQLKAAKYRRWKHLSENGGILISPFISQAEKEVRRQCEAMNGKIILLSNKPFEDREKPSLHDFERCIAGQLLIIAPMTGLPPGRETFLHLNSIAETLALNLNPLSHI